MGVPAPFLLQRAVKNLHFRKPRGDFMFPTFLIMMVALIAAFFITNIVSEVQTADKICTDAYGMNWDNQTSEPGKPSHCVQKGHPEVTKPLPADK